MGVTLLLFQPSRLDLYALMEREGFSNSVTLRAPLALLTYVPAGDDWLDAETLNFLLYSFIMAETQV